MPAYPCFVPSTVFGLLSTEPAVAPEHCWFWPRKKKRPPKSKEGECWNCSVSLLMKLYLIRTIHKEQARKIHRKQPRYVVLRWPLYYALGLVWKALSCPGASLTPPSSQWARCAYQSHFIDKKTSTERTVIWLWSLWSQTSIQIQAFFFFLRIHAFNTLNYIVNMIVTYNRNTHVGKMSTFCLHTWMYVETHDNHYFIHHGKSFLTEIWIIHIICNFICSIYKSYILLHKFFWRQIPRSSLEGYLWQGFL